MIILTATLKDRTPTDFTRACNFLRGLGFSFDRAKKEWWKRVDTEDFAERVTQIALDAGIRVRRKEVVRDQMI